MNISERKKITDRVESLKERIVEHRKNYVKNESIHELEIIHNANLCDTDNLTFLQELLSESNDEKI